MGPEALPRIDLTQSQSLRGLVVSYHTLLWTQATTTAETTTSRRTSPRRASYPNVPLFHATNHGSS